VSESFSGTARAEEDVREGQDGGCRFGRVGRRDPFHADLDMVPGTECDGRDEVHAGPRLGWQRSAQRETPRVKHRYGPWSLGAGWGGVFSLEFLQVRQ